MCYYMHYVVVRDTHWYLRYSFYIYNNKKYYNNIIEKETLFNTVFFSKKFRFLTQNNKRLISPHSPRSFITYIFFYISSIPFEERREQLLTLLKTSTVDSSSSFLTRENTSSDWSSNIIIRRRSIYYISKIRRRENIQIYLNNNNKQEWRRRVLSQRND